MLMRPGPVDTGARDAALIALAGSFLLLGGALVSQHVFGLTPCQMCLWQRWPHGVSLVAATIALALRGRSAGAARALAVVAVVAVTMSGLIGVWHAGVEYGWWPGLSTCAGTADGGGLDAILSRSVVRCDAAPWTLAGVSLAGYNAILSLGTAAFAWSRWRAVAPTSRSQGR